MSSASPALWSSPPEIRQSEPPRPAGGGRSGKGRACPSRARPPTEPRGTRRRDVGPVGRLLVWTSTSLTGEFVATTHATACTRRVPPSVRTRPRRPPARRLVHRGSAVSRPPARWMPPDSPLRYLSGWNRPWSGSAGRAAAEAGERGVIRPVDGPGRPAEPPRALFPGPRGRSRGGEEVAVEAGEIAVEPLVAARRLDAVDGGGLGLVHLPGGIEAAVFDQDVVIVVELGGEMAGRARRHATADRAAVEHDDALPARASS